MAEKSFGGTLAGTITLTAGLGGMGGAQPLAVTMNEGVAICVEVDQARITRRIEHRYLDVQADDLDHALALAIEARDARRPLSIGLLGNAAEVFPALLEREAPIDVVTDQTSAHDPLAYLPIGTAPEDWDTERGEDPVGFHQARAGGDGRPRARDGRDAGRRRRGLRLRQLDPRRGAQGRLRPGLRVPRVRPGLHPAAVLRRPRPVPLGGALGRPADIAATDRAVLELFPDDDKLRRWLTMAGEKVHFQGLPARICWLGYGERHLAGLKFNEMVASGELKAPVVIGRDHLDCGSVASPYRETEAMLDGSDAIADWPLLNALVNTASGASWVSLHHGGGVGIGRSLHAGQVCVADGTPEAAARLERVLTNDPGMGVIRHVDAGYDEADRVADERGVRIPMARG